MKTLEYSIAIAKPQQFVFERIIDHSVYGDWAKAWSAGTTFVIEGEWRQGATVVFYDPAQGGTKVTIEAFEPYSHIGAVHTAMVGPDTKELTELDPMMQKWIGSHEDYYFDDNDDGTTTLRIVMETDEMFQPMFDGKWPKALELFKEVCELG